MRKLFQKWLFLCILFSFCVTLAVSFWLQTLQAEKNAHTLLAVNLEEAATDIQSTSANLRTIKALTAAAALAKARALAAIIAQNPAVLNSPVQLQTYLGELDADELHVSDKNGILVASTSGFVGYDMASAPQSAAFMPAIHDLEFELVQEPVARGVDKTLFQYAGVPRVDEPGIVQIGYYPERLEEATRVADIRSLAPLYHIGTAGFLVISQAGRIVSAGGDGALATGGELPVFRAAGMTSGKTFPATINGTRYLCLNLRGDTYDVTGFLPQSELFFSRDMMLVYLVLGNLVLFLVVFGLISLLVQRLVINDVHTANAALKQITEGRLDTRLDIHTTPEFTSLSESVNIMVDSLKRAIAEAAARIDSELEFARTIQLSTLRSTFPAYPERSEFDIYALMHAAREVGGDFYDFFLVDDDHLAVLVADVSGKGIGAAMFMMIAKSLIKRLAYSGRPVAEVFAEANAALCENNEQEMFLTAWLGIVHLPSGRMACVNAGHNPPLLFRQKSGVYEFLRLKRGPVLAALDTVRYVEQTLELEPGDRLLLYTDGVTEAMNPAGGMFTDARLLDCANQRLCGEDAHAAVDSLRGAVRVFADGAEQSDDITILLLEYRGHPLDELRVPAALDSLDQVVAFVDAHLEAAACPPRAQTQVCVAVEEVFVNIARYAYKDRGGEAVVRCGVGPGASSLTVQFADQGIPFNPLEQSLPDITLGAEQRTEGGLGVLMVRKIMDSVQYVYADGKNILTMRKRLTPPGEQPMESAAGLETATPGASATPGTADGVVAGASATSNPARADR